MRRGFSPARPHPKSAGYSGLREPGAESAPETRLPCPRCADFLNETRVHENVLSACRSCGGIWIDTATVERLKRGRDEEVESAAQRIGQRASSFSAPEKNLSIACPVCRSHLRRVALVGTAEAVDVCDAHGTWFDAFEAARTGPAPVAAAGPPPRGIFSRLFG